MKLTPQFLQGEKSFREMLANGGILVGDRWFGVDSSELDRARYLVSYLRRQECNRRRRERRKLKAEYSLRRESRSGCRRIPLDHEAQVANRLPLERRKCLRRSTLAECPTAADIRTAWHFRKVSNAASMRLGGMLLDLECYVDNSLVTIVCNHRLKIVGRRGGLRTWIHDNCPELDSHYKTLQRIKGKAKSMRQRLDIMDPIPVSLLMTNVIHPEDLPSLPVHVQPRGDDEAQPVLFRFAWEQSQLKFDSDGRPYFGNANYKSAQLGISEDFLSQCEGFRAIFRAAIILNDKERLTIENYSARDESVVGKIGMRESHVTEDNRIGNVEGGIRRACEDIGEMVRYVGKNPRILADVGTEIGKNIGKVLVEVALPERTLERIRDGEKVGIGTFAWDAVNSYAKFYSQFLVYRSRFY